MDPKRLIVAGLIVCACSASAGLYTAAWMVDHPSAKAPLQNFQLIRSSEATVPDTSFDSATTIQSEAPVIGLDQTLSGLETKQFPLAQPDISTFPRNSLISALPAIEIPVDDAQATDTPVVDEVVTQDGDEVDAPYPLRKPDIARILGALAPKPVRFQSHVAHRAAQARQTMDCMALAVYWEAQSEGDRGMRAVAHVVKNRMEHRRFPNSVCGVIRQSNSNGCQFSWWCDGRSDKPVTKRAWIKAVSIARAVLDGTDEGDLTKGAIFFNGTWQDTPWTRDRVQTVSIGRHAFYR